MYRRDQLIKALILQIFGLIAVIALPSLLNAGLDSGNSSIESPFLLELKSLIKVVQTIIVIIFTIGIILIAFRLVFLVSYHSSTETTNTDSREEVHEQPQQQSVADSLENFLASTPAEETTPHAESMPKASIVLQQQPTETTTTSARRVIRERPSEETKVESDGDTNKIKRIIRG